MEAVSENGIEPAATRRRSGTTDDPKKSSSSMFASFLRQNSAKIAASQETPRKDELIPKSIDIDLEQIGNVKKWLLRPCERGQPPIQCFIDRDKGLLGLYPTYRLYVEPQQPGGKQKFVMSGKKNAQARTAYFNISTDTNPGDRGNDGSLGKVRGNNAGTQFVIFDGGLNPEKSTVPSSLRKEHGVFQFTFTADNPCNTEVWIPAVHDNGLPVVWQPAAAAQTMDVAVDAGNMDNLIKLRNKLPKWDEERKGNVLDFKGRVTESSVKNFQLICDETGDDTSLMFGKAGKERYVMDVQYPLSLYQAFSICICMLDKTSNNTFKLK
eukprot:gene5420-10846_t